MNIESTKPILESWETTSGVEFAIEEASSEVDGVYILAKIAGPCFFPETTSRNNVFYPQDAWEQAISDPEFQSRLKDRLVYGTIGHDSELTDTDIREGKASHIVTRIWINEENVGMAEYLILNTKAGRNLNTYVRAKSKLRVSTKADGLFKSTPQSSKTVVPSAFRLVRVDFVQSPGYKEALPGILESQEVTPDTNVSNAVQESINTPLNKEINMENDKVVQLLESQISELKSEKTLSAQQVTSIAEELVKVKTSMAGTESVLESYKAIGTPVQILESQSELAQYKIIGSVQEIHEAIEGGTEALDALTSTVSELTDQIEDLKSQVVDANAAADSVVASSQPDPDSMVLEGEEELGTPSDIRDALDQAELQRVELEQYRELGSVEDIQAALDAAEGVAESIEGGQAEELASQFGVDVSAVTNAQDKGLSLDEVAELLKSLRPAATTPAVTEDATGVDDTAAPGAGIITDPNVTSSDVGKKKDEPEEPEITESYSSRLFSKIRKTHQIAESTASDKPILNTLGARLMNRR